MVGVGGGCRLDCLMHLALVCEAKHKYVRISHVPSTVCHVCGFSLIPNRVRMSAFDVSETPLHDAIVDSHAALDTKATARWARRCFGSKPAATRWLSGSLSR